MDYPRKAYVANYFYPGDKRELEENIKELFYDEKGAGSFFVNDEYDKKVVGVIVPHAGYMYSGYTASFSYKKIAEHGNPRNFIIIGPNHTGQGNNISIYSKGSWETPLGEAKINEKLASKILNNMEGAREDENAHLFEHSIEVQLPFLQYIFKEFEFVPICLKDQSYETTKRLANALFNIKEDFIIIASSDLNHYDSHITTKEKDILAIRSIEKMDALEFYKTMDKFNISICGYGAISCLMQFAKKKKAKPYLLDHKTSGEVSGDMLRTVGYLSMSFER